MKDYLKRNLVENHVLIAVVAVAFIWLLIQLQGVLVSLFVAYILMAAILPTVNILEKRKVPKVLAVAIVYLVLLLLIVAVVLPPIPFLFHQFQQLAENFPLYLERAGQIFGIPLQGLLDTSFLSRNAFSVTSKIFGGIFGVVTTLVISIYLVLERDRLLKFVPQNVKARIVVIDSKLGGWLRGQVVLSFAVGLVVWLGLTILGIPFAMPIAIIAGLLEIVPMVGPVIAAIPGVIVALTISPQTAMLTVGLYIIVQLLENNLLVPKIMEQAVGFSPLAVILALIIGGELMGITGALLAIPATLVLLEVIHPQN